MINENLSTEKSILIEAPAENIWDTLTNPDKIKLYLFGSNVKTDWKPGNPITFTRDRVHAGAELSNQPIADKGQILEVEERELFKYTYFSSQEGYEDKPGNYSTITYRIKKINDTTHELSYLRKNIPIEIEQKNQEKYLPGMLEHIKKLTLK